jgi:two-component system response regulator YesN
MWKVLIADDEPKIRRGLRASVERIRPDMQVVAEAEDGETALALVQSEKPDILMIDIRMPFLNGLELIERINEVHRDCVIIVVSGHDEFEYAKRALQLKVFEYVLKPVPREVLASVLQRAEAELAGARRQNKYIEWAREQLKRNMPLLREQFLRDWVNGRLSRSEIEERTAFLGIGIPAECSMAVVHVVERFLGVDPAKEKDRRLVHFAVQKVVEEAFHEFAPLVVFQDEHDNIVAITASTGGPDWVEAFSRMESDVSRSLSLSVVVAQKPIPEGSAGIPDAYEALTAEVARKSSYRTFVVLAQEFIDTHYAQPELSLEEVATAVGISPGYLSRLLKQETGLSFIDYITRLRITNAVQLMNDPAIKIYEVAEAVGYQSQHYFSRAFKKVLGRSPVEYRKGGAC